MHVKTGFMLFWCILLHMKDGARDDRSSYRLHLWHSTISSYLCIHSFLYPGRYPEYAVIACSLSYFLVDLNNMLFNDVVYRVGGYQKKSARLMEYFHHILSIGATGAAAFNITQICDMQALRVAFTTGPMNPLLRFALADVSTPFLMLWRRGNQQSTLWYTIFVILFILVRIVYHGFYFVPTLYQVCPNERVQYGLIAYQAIQVVSLFFVLGKWKDMLSGKAQKQARDKEEKDKAATAAETAAAAAEATDGEEEDKKTK